MPEQDVIKLVEQLRKAIIAKDTETMTRLANAYGEIYRELQSRINVLAEVIAGLDPADLSAAKLGRLEAYKSLLKEVEQQLTKFQGYAEMELTAAARQSIAAGILDAELLTKSSGFTGSFMRLNPGAVENMIAFLQKAGAMYGRIRQLAPTIADKISNALINGIALGDNPQTTAKALVSAFNQELGGALVDIMRTARTSQIWAYREANRASYIANSDVVTGWIWFAELEGACLGCAAMHGTQHGLDETLDDHYNGRCSMIPITILNPNPEFPTGEDWFKGLSEAEQREKMGDAKYEAWKDGKFEFNQMATHSDNEVYGSMTTQTPNKDLFNE